ncbi:MAG: 50S ribosomal protein L19 [Candidatus Brocadia sp. AMX2]|uniref:Large ribosomal subunit protein bL19 n=1 Tax=Candidatus Brocadia sinica JPN1 TaxID=1197129 RepID=A0ABQ0JZ11_9BACT|nr:MULTISPECIES: 50S ribosomal protein L19 [Brocadia]KXK31744.1 MAG: 50S ribosomal protein L19 [Candidatus Brocadia sinica]MBC6932193.1 50S ribosomal protein L19 [Candidatus Brocadia sp.]MBL1168465.1 50S ribosomal protein L19 [Candidatus Brocadia sp. AMX1]NOG40252.1 50S ribosomal protein L19 [Planctomycetota bacterium]KAA0243634.1 MAG: 50S ribosomal protein L19 [Candidatus Brocadia sp. AMX2]
MNIIDAIEKEQMKKTTQQFSVGDQVDVSVKIVEGDKERVQVFSGVVIAKNGGGFKETFTVRRIVQGEGVERVFPVHSPKIVDIKVIKSGRVRRAKLYYMRERTSKGTRLQEKFETTASKSGSTQSTKVQGEDK